MTIIIIPMKTTAFFIAVCCAVKAQTSELKKLLTYETNPRSEDI